MEVWEVGGRIQELRQVMGRRRESRAATNNTKWTHRDKKSSYRRKERGLVYACVCAKESVSRQRQPSRKITTIDQIVTQGHQNK